MKKEIKRAVFIDGKTIEEELEYLSHYKKPRNVITVHNVERYRRPRNPVVIGKV